MKFTDFSKMPLGKILGCKIKYKSMETDRSRTGVVMAIDFRQVRVARPRDYTENVSFSMIERIVSEVE